MTRKGLTAVVVGGLIVAGGLAFFISPLASSSPDGLERVATDEGFIDTAQDHDLADGPLADYGVQGVDDESLSTGLVGHHRRRDHVRHRAGALRHLPLAP